jgi:hypothetical protein
MYNYLHNIKQRVIQEYTRCQSLSLINFTKNFFIHIIDSLCLLPIFEDSTIKWITGSEVEIWNTVHF